MTYLTIFACITGLTYSFLGKIRHHPNAAPGNLYLATMVGLSVMLLFIVSIIAGPT